MCCESRGNGVSLSLKAFPGDGEVTPAGDIASEIEELQICYLKKHYV